VTIFIFTGLGIVFLVVIYRNCNQEVARRHAERELRRQTNQEHLVHKIAQQIRRSLDLDQVLATTVAEVKQFLQADRVLIYRIWEDGTGSAITEAVSPHYVSILGETFPEEVFPREYHQAYTQGKTRVITNVEQCDVELCLAQFVQQFGVKAKLVVPILQERCEPEALADPVLPTHLQHISASSPTQPYL